MKPTIGQLDAVYCRGRLFSFHILRITKLLIARCATDHPPNGQVMMHFLRGEKSVDLKDNTDSEPTLPN
jgi:hypothetical protein